MANLTLTALCIVIFSAVSCSGQAPYEDLNGCGRWFGVNYRCADGGSCIAKSNICDGRNQCPDGSDEVECDGTDTEEKAAFYDHNGCARSFPTYPYRCADGSSCIPKRNMCDGHKLCRDGSDEVGCGNQNDEGSKDEGDSGDKKAAYYDEDCAKSFPSSPYRCADGSFCIPKHNVCDGHKLCSDGSDEMGCGSGGDETTAGNGNGNENSGGTDTSKDAAYYDKEMCAVRYPDSPYMCADNSMCLRESQICSGNSECKDYSDEVNCGFGKTDSNGCTLPNQKGNSGTKDFMDQLLEAHNYFRCLHGVGPMTWDSKLEDTGKAVATDNARRNSLKHSSYGYGENLAMAQLPDMDHATGYGFAKMWYDEIKDYDYNNPGFKSGTGHFTQVVWKGSKSLGCGVVDNSGTIWLACEYSPGGNMYGQFQDNVPRPL